MAMPAFVVAPLPGFSTLWAEEGRLYRLAQVDGLVAIYTLFEIGHPGMVDAHIRRGGNRAPCLHRVLLHDGEQVRWNKETALMAA